MKCMRRCEMGTNTNGSMNKTMILILGMLAVALVAGRMWARHGHVSDSSENSTEPAGVHETTNPVTGDQRYTLSIPTEGQQGQASQNVWEALQEILKVERIAPFEDPEKRARAAAKSDFNLLRQQVKEFEAQGLGGEELYAALEQRLVDEGVEGARKMLDGYRRLEETLTAADLDGMSPEDRFEVVVKARRDAFGEEPAEHLFFEKEAYTQYKLEEKAIEKDTGLTDAEKQAEIIGRRNTLQVELASRGSYVSFADERRIELDQRLRERYGESVGTMSEEERSAAIIDLYRNELPPETLERVEQVLTAQAARKSRFEAYRSESEAILNDQDLSFDEKQERLAELSAQYDTSPSSTGL
jgi:hypothetical protein